MTRRCLFRRPPLFVSGVCPGCGTALDEGYQKCWNILCSLCPLNGRAPAAGAAAGAGSSAAVDTSADEALNALRAVRARVDVAAVPPPVVGNACCSSRVRTRAAAVTRAQLTALCKPPLPLPVAPCVEAEVRGVIGAAVAACARVLVLAACDCCC